MATMYITEYRTQARDGKGNTLPAGQEPAITVQTVSFTATAGQSAALDPMTTFVRVFCDADANLAFGLSPTAVDGADTPIEANTPEFFGLDTDFSSMRISAVNRS